jgi:hypothetical protein
MKEWYSNRNTKILFLFAKLYNIFYKILCINIVYEYKYILTLVETVTS